MKILAIETATEACSAALLIDDDIRERYDVAAQGHSRLILPMMDELMQEAGLRPQELDAIAFGRGPGSFTGVRIATSVAQGAAYAADIPLIPVSTLAALADAVNDDSIDGVLAGIDARMSEIYYLPYGMKTGYLTDAEVIVAPGDLHIPEQGRWVAVGSAWKTYPSCLTGLHDRLVRVDPDALPRASNIARLARVMDWSDSSRNAMSAAPVYLRNKVAEKPKQKKLG